MSSKQFNDGVPAFPSVGEGFGNPRYSAPGMSLRDYFAAKAMQAIRAEQSQLLECKSIAANNGTGDVEGVIAHFAYRQADAMLAQRTK